MNPLPSWDQISGIVDRSVLVILTYAVAKGWIAGGDVQPLLALIVGLGGIIWGAWVNSKTSILKSAAAIPEVNRIALNKDAPQSAALNAATPDKVFVAGK